MIEAVATVASDADGVKLKSGRSEKDKRRDQAYYEKNKAKIKARNKAWREKNKGAMLSLKKRWMISNRDRVNAERRRSYSANRVSILEKLRTPEVRAKSNERLKKWQAKNRDKVKAAGKRSRAKCKARRDQQLKEWKAKNRAHVLQYHRDYRKGWLKKRLANDLAFKVKRALSSRLWAVLKNGNNSKIDRALKLAGCSIESLIAHIESLFAPGMTWKNWGKWNSEFPTWQIDHVRPCAAFNLAYAEHQRRCFHYTNLQPLWAADNIRKSDRIDGLPLALPLLVGVDAFANNAAAASMKFLARNPKKDRLT